MNIMERLKSRLTAKYSDWIKVEDDDNPWTIEDFPYESGVDESLTHPHCCRCVTVNKCYFANETGKKPEPMQDEKGLAYALTKESGLYHPHCHCEEIGVQSLEVDRIQLIIASGKIDYLFSKKLNDIINTMGYTIKDKEEIIQRYSILVKEAYVEGNYKIKEHSKYGVRITIFYDFPGKNEKQGRKYKIKSGWAIFPNGKLKANTIMGGFV